MRIVLALDKFKGSLSAVAVGEAVARGLKRALPNIDCQQFPVADGGEGTVDAVETAIGGERHEVEVWNANRSRRVKAPFLLKKRDGQMIGYLEMASASGLALLSEEELNPNAASTYGTGELMKAAIAAGADQLVVGLGGSATNDGGVGLAQCLGFRFECAEGELTMPLGLGGVERIVAPESRSKVKVTALADVQNPLLGPNGATAVYGPQKGVEGACAKVLESGLTHLADLVQRDLGVDYREVPGAGAAGGCAFGLMSFLEATIEPGFDYLSRMTDLETAIAKADLVVTGEGRLDAQTLQGKAPAGVAALAKKHGTPVAAIAGAVEEEALINLRETFDPILWLTKEAPLEEAIRDAERLLEKQGEQLGLAFSSAE